MMEFTECEESGQLVATGDKGQYWINEDEFVELARMIPTPAGPDSVMLGVFKTVECAIKTANQLDEAGL